jgi:chromosome segregation ATPase
MPKNPELDRLKTEQQSLFEQKQAAFQRFKDLQEQTNTAHDIMQSAWDERTRAREKMNREFEARQTAYSHRDSVWEEYGRIRDYNNSRIQLLKNEADAEHRTMQDCFERASSAYQYGDKSEAPYYSQQGHEHRERRDMLNTEISELIREVKQAKANAEASAPRISSYAFDSAKSTFESAKARHESAQAEFKRLKAQRDSAKAEFDRLQAQFKQAQAAFNRKLEEVKTARASEKQKSVDKVNMALVKSNAHYLGTLFGQNAKIVPHDDGTTHIFFGGLSAAGDGIGHGHAVIDRDGNVTYLRDAWQDHDDYLIDDSRKRGTDTHNI